MKPHNFNSGPAILPQEVLDHAAKAVLDFNNTGLSILEIGHRTDGFQEILDQAVQSVKRLMNLGEEYAVLFLHGGATTQFMQVPMNLLSADASAAYCVNGIWGEKAASAASQFGNIIKVADSSDQQHRYINKNIQVPEHCTYLHLTSNNTVEGTQWHQFPETKVPIVADMSSDIFSRSIDFSKFSFIYAGAQKNMGAAGVNLVVVKKAILGKLNRAIPSIMDYQKHIAAGSVMNTPPVFAIYVSMLTLKWMEDAGGLAVMQASNAEKSNLLYHTLDSLPLFTSYVAKEDRSLMNAVFFIENKALQEKFLTTCHQEGMIGVKGYRTVGGIRVSMYNALPLKSVQLITDLMKDFAQKNG